MKAHIAQQPEPLARLCPGVPEPLATVVMRCLAKSPSARPTSKDLSRELDVVAGVSRARVQVWRQQLRRRWLIVCAVAGAMLLGAAAVGSR